MTFWSCTFLNRWDLIISDLQATRIQWQLQWTCSFKQKKSSMLFGDATTSRSQGDYPQQKHGRFLYVFVGCCCFLHNPRVAGSPACQGPHYGEVQLPARRIDTTPWRRSIEKINLKWRSTSLIEFQRRKIRLSDFLGWCWFWNSLNIILVTIIYTTFLSIQCIEIAFQRIK